MDKLVAMRTLVSIVDEGTMTAAAEALGTSLPSVVRTLAALESALGVRLLARTTRRLSLTDEGREYVERCRRVLAEVEDAEAALSARRRTPRGRLRITASVAFGRLHVAPMVTEFVARHPALAIDLLLLDRSIDLIDEGVDLAVRIGRLPDSSLVALPVGHTGRLVCASPAYLRRAGVPRTPQALAAHRCIVFTGLGQSTEWDFGGRPPQRVSIRPVLSTNQTDVTIDACLHGLGVGRFLEYQVRSLVRSRRLRRLLADDEPDRLPVQFVYPQARLLSANVRAFIAFAMPRLKDALRDP